MLSSVFTMGWAIQIQNSSKVLCKLLYYSAYVFSAFLPTILIFASIDRLFISSRSVDLRLYSSKRLAYFSVSASAIFWIVFYIHVLVKVTVREIYASFTICYYEITSLYYEFNFYSNLLINTIFSIGIIIVSIITLKNVQQIRDTPRQQRNRFRTMSKKDFQLLHCLYVYDLVYIILVAFPSIYGIYQAVSKDNIQSAMDEAIEGFVTNFGTFIHHLPYCASFFIFVCVSKSFRLEMKRLVYKVFGQDLVLTRTHESGRVNIDKDMLQTSL
ncbi:unnamed protein product [Adineta ricciae]|uniref:G-protein coupled receptors family 1 profile domain-containing protein n=1 Tax=Adineta ricciae TaxID=249248 RepID=A0A814DE45_ADIRI|nr:unnamed protein product [Adineta ricciae]